ncbi:MAG: hypothetical protein GWM98_25325 [Nitrospinaceae bacterium]|nr:hypothetical protein [Nitrospinaceae bacterium]NIR57188.1 hypothetical protein [Nitrospinaceae bacterium]NIS87630.1 hypothetical protein [Nitrospinaceae bacterium]NIT84498.1 hypothetical protein [Nitrospinaceae bacterium]NIU46687.1 hypothetical protein [Nitrospinaceae bacterium]
MKDASGIIADWKRRLIAMADNPPYVFKNTPQKLIDQHYQHLTSFVGYSQLEVETAEKFLGLRLPTLFRTYLLEMGRSPGDLFCGSDLAKGPADLMSYKKYAQEKVAEADTNWTLPREAVVFLSHQGYQFDYILASDPFDGPVMTWSEIDPEPIEIAPTFEKYVDRILSGSENLDKSNRNSGGYYLTIHPDGGTSQSYPAADDEPPLK